MNPLIIMLLEVGAQVATDLMKTTTPTQVELDTLDARQAAAEKAALEHVKA